ncbi:MAG: ABC transporter substrate-binding protein [Clostridia bacterium]|nr:ABC transporter substrate-binding protein [Clostridia bacterium]
MKNWRKVIALVLVLAMAFAMTVSASAEESVDVTPRNETLYFGGMQWGAPNDINPFSPSSNCFPMNQNDNAREIIYETLYMYNMLDGSLTPLLAEGDPDIAEDQKTITVKLNPAAHWSDGTPVTAKDVEATFNKHVEVGSNTGNDMGMYIASMEATDDYTVVIKANEDNFNPLKVKEYLPKLYICQAAYLEKMTEEFPESEGFKTATWWDAPHTGPYTLTVHNEQKVLMERDDNYWGQDESMWGKLPTPKYICHNIYSGNDTTAIALQNGEIDMDQQFVANIWTFWEDMGLPISTYIDEAPYFLDASMPTIWFNCQKNGLDQTAVRVAVAMAIDYDQIIASAMSGYSYTFAEVPHSLFNPTEGEQDMYKKCDEDGSLSALNYAGKDIDGANALLDEAGIVDADGDGYREVNGEKLAFTVECPTGWSDWNASCEIVAAAGQAIGVDITTYFPESSVWSEDYQTGNFDIIMHTMAAASVDAMWLRAYQTCYGFGGEFPERQTYGLSRWYNERADEILAAIPVTTDEEELVALYKELNVLYLTECPSVALMYRPAYFHEVNESVWSGFPEQGDGDNIPPTCLVDGYGVAALYNLVAEAE